MRIGISTAAGIRDTHLNRRHIFCIHVNVLVYYDTPWAFNGLFHCGNKYNTPFLVDYVFDDNYNNALESSTT